MRAMEPSISKKTEAAVTTMRIGKSRKSALRITITGEIIAVVPRIRAIFAMLLP